MKILILQNDSVPAVQVTGMDRVTRACPPGTIVSVSHANGRRLIYRLLAQWVEREPFDPYWDPPANFKAAKPTHDKMMRGTRNKEIA